MCVSEASQLLVLSAVVELLEAAKVDARRVGVSSLDGVAFSLEGLLNHELPHENKPGDVVLDPFDPSSVFFVGVSSSPTCPPGARVPSSLSVPTR